MSPPFPTTEYHIAGPPKAAFELAVVLSPVALEPHAIAIALAQSLFAGGYTPVSYTHLTLPTKA